MGRGGGNHSSLEHWHERAVDLPDGDVLRWVLIDDPVHRRPHAECFRRVDPDGSSRGVHPTEALRLLGAVGHPDVAHVGRSMSH